MSLQIPKYADFGSISLIPENIFEIYYNLEKKFASKTKWKNRQEYDLWHELCLCILASNIPYEQALSATNHLDKNDLLDQYWILENTIYSKNRIAYELSLPVFLPKKKDGNLRKYRFPNVRAKNIVKSADILYHDGQNLKTILQNSESERSVRDFLALNLSGIGFKESSHFLRNIGFASTLAIVDVHIISFLKNLHLLPKNFKLTNVTQYMEIEEIMQKIANYYSMNLGILDNAIWYYIKTNNQ